MAALMVGDTDALALLVGRHHSDLLGFLYRMVGGNRQLAEDLVQDTFTRVLSQRTYTAGRRFKPWLYAIATNLVRDRQRSEARYPAQVCLADEIGDPGPGPEELALSRSLEQEVVAAVMALSEEYRAVLLLRFFHGMTLQGIAEALAIPVGTVKSRLSVGSHRLRELLGATYDEEARW